MAHKGLLELYNALFYNAVSKYNAAILTQICHPKFQNMNIIFDRKFSIFLVFVAIHRFILTEYGFKLLVPQIVTLDQLIRPEDPFIIIARSLCTTRIIFLNYDRKAKIVGFITFPCSKLRSLFLRIFG